MQNQFSQGSLYQPSPVDEEDGLHSRHSSTPQSGIPQSRSVINLSPTNSSEFIAANEFPIVGLGKKQQQLIQILSADKVIEGTKSHVAYTISVSPRVYEELKVTGVQSGGGNVTLQRRYSDFESLSKVLSKRYPHIVIPPIPQKHSLTELSKKDDYRIVEHRKHLLLTFLLRIHHHPVLSSDAIFSRFIQPGNWTDALYSQQSSPKKASAMLGAGKKLNNPDLKFVKLEEIVDKQTISFQALEREEIRCRKKLQEISSSQAELGSILNAFSLHEGNNHTLAFAIEKVGQAMDNSHLASSAFATSCENYFGNHLHEYTLFSQHASNVLSERHKKHAHYETLGEHLDSKRIQLSNLEKGGLLGDSSVGSGALASIMSGITSIGGKVQQFMDSDPEQTRKSNIAKIKAQITTLEKTREDAHTELLKFSEQVSAEVDRYQKQQIEDFHDLALTHAHLLRCWLEKNLNSWKAAKDVVNQIDIE